MLYLDGILAVTRSKITCFSAGQMPVDQIGGMDMDVITAIKTRRTIRSYQDRPIEEEKLERLLTAMQLAPGARNEQDHIMVVVKDEKLRKQIAEACAGQTFVGEAPVVMVMCYTDERIMMCNQAVRPIDCSIALSFMLLEAQELGLGLCWIGAFDARAVKELINAPEEYTVFAVLPIGYPANDGYIRPRKPLSELVRYETWKTEKV
jgi:nitroreductase